MVLVTIQEALKEIANGQMIIVVDDEDRENEGDLVMAAQFVTPQAINFMSKHGRGLICTPITAQTAHKLGLEPMVYANTSQYQTAFTTSVGAAHGITTGISAYDRAYTISLLADKNSLPNSFKKPGHVFPLIAKEGGVLKRPGHTEAAVDLARLAGLHPSGVICEVMNDDGTMKRMADLEHMANQFGLKMITIKDLIKYRQSHESLVQQLDKISLPTVWGSFVLQTFKYTIDGQCIIALFKGVIKEDAVPLVRIHSSCFTGDILRSQRCDCGQQLDLSMELIQKENSGIIIYLQQEGRGIGLEYKVKAYALQEQGLDTVEANFHLGFKTDLRDYALAAQILKSLSIKRIRLLTNNPKKITNLSSYGVEVVERVSLEVQPNIYNQRYLATKRQKMEHLLQF